MSRRRLLALATPLLVTGLLAGACAGSSDRATERAEAAATTTSVGSTIGAAAAAGDPFCQKVAEAGQKFGLDLSVTNLGAALQQLPEAAALLAQAQTVAPAEIKGDITVLAGTLKDLTPLLTRIATLNAAAQTDASAAAEAQKATLELMGRLTSTQSTGFATAVANLNTYSKQHCGVKFA